jgi:hypothetical protein
MDQLLDAFIEAHPEGWGHDDWLGLLAQLRHAAVHVDDPAELGQRLESRRLAWVLDRMAVSGLGPRRTEAIVDRFGTLWRLRHTNAAELAEIKTIPASLAERIVEAVRDSGY